jgi:membrane-associated phospholipid phosphatase
VSLLVPSRPRLVVSGLAVFVVVAACVAAGAFTWLDQFAVSHLMPWLRIRRHTTITLSDLTLPGAHGPAGRLVCDLWTYPAAFVPSLVLVIVASSFQGPASAIRWSAAWVAGNALELAGKLTVDRPSLHHHGLTVPGFESSLPSGHTIRALVVAAVVAATWRRGRLAYIWAALVPVALVLLGAHVPTDVVAGLSAAAAVVGWFPRRLGSGAAGRSGRGWNVGTTMARPRPRRPRSS